eukprot:scaffold35278_cov54-Attheya_sp.AAC.6
MLRNGTVPEPGNGGGKNSDRLAATSEIEAEDVQHHHSLPRPEDLEFYHFFGESQRRIKYGGDKGLIYLLILSVNAVIILWIIVIAFSVGNSSYSKAQQERAPGAPYSCPTNLQRAQNDVADYFDVYRQNARELFRDPSDLQNYAITVYDGFGPNTSYTEMKLELYMETTHFLRGFEKWSTHLRKCLWNRA